MKTLESFDFGRSVDRSTYDWDSILNGEVNVLEAGKDFTCKAGTLKMRARAVAKKLGKKIRTGKDKDGNVVVQAYKPDADELKMDAAKASARKPRKPKAAPEVDQVDEDVEDLEDLDAVEEEAPKQRRRKGK